MDEKERAVAELNAAADRFVRTVAASPARWGSAPPAGWSPSQITEHVAISCDNIARLLRGHLASNPIERDATGVLDAMQWLLFAAAHVERHRAQAIGVLSEADSPR